jgi:hypothetical protein
LPVCNLETLLPLLTLHLKAGAVAVLIGTGLRHNNDSTPAGVVHSKWHGHLMVPLTYAVFNASVRLGGTPS